MKIKFSVTEFLQVCKAIRLRPERIFKMIRSEIREAVGHYLNEMMREELTDYLGCQPYERKESEGNHRNGSYHRSLTLKEIGPVDVDIKKGRRPSFDKAEDPEKAEKLLNYFTELIRQRGIEVKTGIFGALMDVRLINDGPVTFILHSRE